LVDRWPWDLGGYVDPRVRDCRNGPCNQNDHEDHGTVGFRDGSTAVHGGRVLPHALISMGVGKPPLYTFGVSSEGLSRASYASSWRGGGGMDRRIGRMYWSFHHLRDWGAALVGPACGLRRAGKQVGGRSTETPPACRVSTIQRWWRLSPTKASWKAARAAAWPMRDPAAENTDSDNV